MDNFDFTHDPNGEMLFKGDSFEDPFMNEFPDQQQHSAVSSQPFYSHTTSQSQSPDVHDFNSLGQHMIQQHQPIQHQPVQTQSVQHRHDSQKRTRASGEVLALLIKEFNMSQNPSAATRKRISEATGMPERSVRIWFQNRRAKSRKLEKAAATTEKQEEIYPIKEENVGFSRYDQIPLTLNNNYYFIDAKSLTVGSWKRLKSGNLSNDNIFNVKNLSNLSPQSINEIMTNSTDLMLIISKKNFEINYFFSAITDNSKILFRIFYPISSVNDCSLSIVQETDDTKEPSCELKLHLNKPPKFAVSFSQLIVQNNNQWSICDDFSEGHQVNDAFIGGSGIPHVFSGLESSLKFMNSFILEYNSTNVAKTEFELPRPPSRSPNGFPIQIHQNISSAFDQLQQDQPHENPLLHHFVNDNLNEFDNFIQQPDDQEEQFAGHDDQGEH